MTCGDCKHYEEQTCYAPDAQTPLNAVIMKSDAACDLFVLRPVERLVVVQPRTGTPLDMLSEETRAKLNRQHRDWHKG